MAGEDGVVAIAYRRRLLAGLGPNVSLEERHTAARTIERLEASQAIAKLVGDAPTFRRAITQLTALAGGNAPVLVHGETGTGKELVARAIHYISDRRARPFVPVNCGSLPDTLLEDELFGHEPGAFTDARARRVGLVAQAGGGTLFLDEVDSLTPRAQVALLRVLQDSSFRPLGSSQEHRVDIRFVAATNVDLLHLVRHGGFRADLYYRLSVLSLQLPSLRERRSDIVTLARHFLAKHARRDRLTPRLSAAAEAALEAAEWPGNVRELENTIIRSIQLAIGDRIQPDDLGLRDVETAADLPLGQFQQRKRDAVRLFELEYLTKLMTEHRGNISHAARTAGKERRELGKLLKKHGLDRRDFSSALHGDEHAPDVFPGAIAHTERV